MNHAYPKDSAESVEQRYLDDALRRVTGKKTEAAKLLGARSGPCGTAWIELELPSTS